MKHNKLSSSLRLKTFIEKLPVSRLWGEYKGKTYDWSFNTDSSFLDLWDNFV